ncbi:MAG TPA: prolyl oligopeptidase family serine peptidase [Bacteroidales bacterium]|nr:prolyl oligopeptidase family serine peptidase [Bacteroidales bacterium]
MKYFSSLFISVFLLVFQSAAQKVPLNHEVYDSWKAISSPEISDDGKWILYEVNPQQGDGWLFLYNSASKQKDSVFCGFQASIAPDSRYFAYFIKPTYAETRSAKVKKLKDDQLPKNSLEIRLPEGRVIRNAERVKSFSVPESGSYWMAYLLEKKTSEKGREKADTSKTVARQNSGKTPEPKGSGLIIYNPVRDKEYTFSDVTEYSVARDGKSIAFLQVFADTTKIDNYKVSLFNTGNESVTTVFEGKGSLQKLSCNKSGELVSFIYTADTSKVRVFDLWISSSGARAVKAVASENNQDMPAGWSVSENTSITFSDDRTRVFFGIAPKPQKEPEDTLLPEEKYRLDIWSWNDDILQPMQKKQIDQEKKRTWQAVYHLDRKKMIRLADSTMPSVITLQRGNCDIALGSSNLPYRKLISWDASNYTDYYIVNLETGERKMILRKAPSRVSVSPSGKYVVYWDESEKQWFSYSVASGTVKKITGDIPFPLFNEINDTPSEPSPYGIEGWLDDEKNVLIRDRYDIWVVNLDGASKPVNLTNGYGRNNNITFRYTRLDREELFIPAKKPLLLSSFDNTTKEAGFFTCKTGSRNDPARLITARASFPGSVIKARNADRIIWQRGSFEVYPDLYTSLTDFTGAEKISNANPQQSAFLWGTVELVKWTSSDGTDLEGLLYKPENFDPARKYPMIVYFYERSSDGLYSYFAPAPSASIINRTFAVSNGYILFVPDIVYKEGYPGQSCYESVVSGTNYLTSRFGFIDKDHIGLGGQSWGGYQIAYLVTRTNLFACAYSGAPVVNMISAYGGIRWETGMSRMFQYEDTQSRIGGTLWEKPLHYIENSPIFRIPDIKTPLLIMSNDADGAVPWYQGIEFITALRRLDKPAWLLSYNDEAHNLVKRPNRKDISIRKMQFFDHYLKGEPMPYWMKYGISQMEKGKKDGYELIK